MSFREHLEVVFKELPGAVACSVMGIDGIEIDTQVAEGGEEDADIKSLLIELSTLMKSVREAAEVHRAGGIQEFSVNTDKLITVARLISPEYLMVIAMKADANYGKARYLLRVTAPKVKQEF
jgi:predicted regulator of Ras-like GTPase activity (Roadblock/LC7/MglB family)